MKEFLIIFKHSKIFWTSNFLPSSGRVNPKKTPIRAAVLKCYWVHRLGDVLKMPFLDPSPRGSDSRWGVGRQLRPQSLTKTQVF